MAEVDSFSLHTPPPLTVSPMMASHVPKHTENQTVTERSVQ